MAQPASPEQALPTPRPRPAPRSGNAPPAPALQGSCRRLSALLRGPQAQNAHPNFDCPVHDPAPPAACPWAQTQAPLTYPCTTELAQGPRPQPKPLLPRASSLGVRPLLASAPPGPFYCSSAPRALLSHVPPTGIGSPRSPAFSLRSPHSVPGPDPAPPPAQFCFDRARHSPAQQREAPPALGGPAQPLPPPAPSPSLPAGSALGRCPHPGLKRHSPVRSALAPGSRHPSRGRYCCLLVAVCGA
ncbi:uncharacterized protein LOC129048021 [Pongo abelii]|uniref:uncharacterized protein LOC129048021 n=1 Tax=Pongo abelii TaxID=9601 RepID=UPI003003D5AA